MLRQRHFLANFHTWQLLSNTILRTVEVLHAHIELQVFLHTQYKNHIYTVLNYTIPSISIFTSLHKENNSLVLTKLIASFSHVRFPEKSPETQKSFYTLLQDDT